jgi:hypothetical protein
MTKISLFTRSFAKSLLTKVVGLEEETRLLKKRGLGVKAEPSVDEFDSLLAEAGFRSRSLLEQHALVVAENESEDIKFAGLGLRLLEETAGWVETNFSKRTYGLIFDVYLLFDLIADEGAVAQKDLMTEMKRREELDIATEAEGQALTAFLCEVPRLFHSATAGTIALIADIASHLSKVPTHKAWANDTGGLKKTIEKKLSRLKSSLHEVLGIELGLAPLPMPSPSKRSKSQYLGSDPFFHSWTKPTNRFTFNQTSAPLGLGLSPRSSEERSFRISIPFVWEPPWPWERVIRPCKPSYPEETPNRRHWRSSLSILRRDPERHD